MIRSALIATVAACMGLAAADWQHVTVADQRGLPSDEIQFIEAGKDGRIWIGTLEGLAFVERGAITTFSDAKGKVLKLATWDVLETEAGVWIGHSDGVLLRKGDSLTAFLRGNTVAPLVPGSDGIIWSIAKDRATERNQLVSGNAAGWNPGTQAWAKQVVDLQAGTDGSVWATIDGDGLARIDAQSGETSLHLRGINVSCLHHARDGQVWAGRWGRGLSVLKDGTWTDHLTKEKSAIIAIRDDTKGGVWAATAGGTLWHLKDGTWTESLTNEDGISLLATTTDGRVFCSSMNAGGLRVYDGSAWSMALSSDLPLRAFHEAEDGTLWVGGILNGIFWLPK